MLTPTSRLLELLELLQTRPLITGTEIADALGVDRRTARRYVAALQQLGILHRTAQQAHAANSASLFG